VPIRSSRRNLSNQYNRWQQTRVIKLEKQRDETYHKAVSQCIYVNTANTRHTIRTRTHQDTRKMAALQDKIQKHNNKAHEKKFLKSVQWDRNPHLYDT
jgi:hypothetical protein